jgi:hypothetical protein
MRYLALLVILFSLEVSAVEKISMELKNSNNNLLLRLTNISQEDLLVNKRFSIGSSVDPCEVELIIYDESGKYFPIDVRVRIGTIIDDDLILLKPGEYIDKEFKLERLILYYDLAASHYTVKAVYKNIYWEDKGVFSDTLISNPVNIEVTEIDVKNSIK